MDHTAGRTAARARVTAVPLHGEDDEHLQCVVGGELRELASRRVDEREVLRQQRPPEPCVGGALARHERMFVRATNRGRCRAGVCALPGRPWVGYRAEGEESRHLADRRIGPAGGEYIAAV
jgi:hypothetical protein